MSRIINDLRFVGTVLIGVLLLFAACKEPTEGCLDVEAVNYDVSADDPCPDDCCEYPRLSLSLIHRFQDSLPFSYDSIYSFEGSDRARFEKVIFYLSDFRLVNLTDSLEVVETIELDLLDGGTETFKDDYTLVSRSIPSFEYDVGEIRGSGTFTVLRFTVGLVGNAENSDAESISNEDHPLALGTDSLWTASDGYIFNQIVVIPDTMVDMMPQRIINIKGQGNLGFVSLSFPQEVDLGFDIAIPIKIDYEKWFSGINFVIDSDEDIAENIVNNTANAFSIDE